MLDPLLYPLPATLAMPMLCILVAFPARRIAVVVGIITIVQDKVLFLSREFLLIRAAVPVRTRTAISRRRCRGSARPPFFVDRCP